MKKLLLFTAALLTGLLLQAQGIYQLWGMTPAGGKEGIGVIFKTDGNGNNFQIKYDFKNTVASGGQPQYTQLVAYNDKFYGMTSAGGTENPVGVSNGGVIFEWDPATNIFLKKIDFTGSNGLSPMGSLTLYKGKFYGMTQMGGINDAGVIFEWDPQTNIYTKKIDLAYSSGMHPQRDLLYSNGKFYGTTYDGGDNNLGVLFQWNPFTNEYIKLLDFDGTNGGHTNGNLTAIGNMIYGLSGGALSADAIFEWNVLTGEYNRRLEFDFYNTGETPQSLTENGGKLYGLNVLYGFDNGDLVEKGMIFEWNPSTGEFIKKTEVGDMSHGETGNLIKNDNKFYGTISGYLGLQNKGLLFEWDPVANVYTKELDFDGSNGANPIGMLTSKDGQLYGMTSAGGAYGWQWDMLGYGVIFRWDPTTSTYTKKIDFGGAAVGSQAVAGLTYYKSKLYGRTGNGGDTYSFGQLFEFDPSENIYRTISNLSESAPCGNLAVNGTKLYGMSTGGNSRGYGGGLFGWDLMSNNFTPGLFFGWPSKEGYFPHGSVTAKDGLLYGMTTSGGQDRDGLQSNDGVLFSWNPVSDNPENYRPLFSFSNPTGSNPYGSLTVKDGKLYGMTIAGGSNNKGVIFEYDPPPSYAYYKKIDFDSANGAYPKGSLTLVDGKFYGMTSAGGAHNAGVIFEWDPTKNIYQKKYDFDGINSSNPDGNLTYSNGKFYGVCFYGRPGYGGLIFEWDPVTNIFTDKLDFNGANGSLPGTISTSGSHDITLVPAPVAKGLPGTCKTFPSVTIDNTNNNQWVSITDEENNAVAEIKANGNNLGIVTASVFINNGKVREDGTGRLYLDRSITITPQFPQKSPIDIRLYIKGSEYTALKNAHNSFGQTAGINSINDIGIFKIKGRCVPVAATISNLISTTGAAWENDYVLSASINSFTSFYFASKNPCAAPVISAVSASPSSLPPADHQMKNVTINYSAKGNCFPITTWLTVTSNEPVSGAGSGDLSPDWIIMDDHHVQLRAETAGSTSRTYTITVNAKNAFGTYCKKSIKVSVPCQPAVLAKGISSGNENDPLDCRLTPNPSGNYFNLQVTTASSEKIEVSLFDVNGRRMSKMNTVKNQTLRFGNDLRPGVYMIKVTQGEQQKIIKIVKE